MLSDSSVKDGKDLELNSNLLIFLVGNGDYIKEGCNSLHESIITLCLEVIDTDYIGRVKTQSILGVDNLLSKNNKHSDIENGIFTLEWLKKTYTQVMTIKIN